MFNLIPGEAQPSKELNFFIPDNIRTFNQDIPKPKDYLGFEIGDMHVNYDQTISYLRELSKKSTRIKLIENGFTYEKKPLVFLIISSEKNLANLETIRLNHLNLCNPDKSVKMDVKGMPVVTWLGYSIHGNEASGVNASLVVSYILASSQDTFIENILENNVIILQPALNPDGVQRYATWVNSNLSYSRNNDENGREFKEPSPTSRSNHYWFDLNRDWLFVQHPESFYRMEIFYQWMPTMLNDYHEHGNTYGSFFSPGIKASTNPLIPFENWELSKKISLYHADILNTIGTVYFSKEGYDDFYTGKGGTLPDLTGGIGLLYEQPNSKGLQRERNGVEIRLTDMIQNQVYCSISALKAACEMKNELLNYQKNFFLNKKIVANNDPIKGYVFGNDSDISLSREFMRILKAHDIKVYRLNKNLSINNKTFNKGYSYIIPTDQMNYTIIKTIFDKTLNYKDSIFYDISTWTVPLALNMYYSEVKELSGLLGEETDLVAEKSISNAKQTNYAYLFEINDYYSYSFIYYLMKNGIKLKVSEAPFSYTIDNVEKRFKCGTFLITVKEQSLPEGDVNKIINSYSGKGKIPVYAVNSGLGNDFDLGSTHFKRITKPIIAILIGRGAAYGSIGELWHLLDWRFDIPVSLIDADNLSDLDINRYNIIVLNNEFKLSKTASDKLSSWAKNNTIIAIGPAYKTTNELGISNITGTKMKDDKDTTSYAKYSEYLQERRVSPVNGIILNSKLDTSHPLGYGIISQEIPLFKERDIIISKPKNRFVTPLYYTGSPLLSGYLTDKYKNLIKNTPAVMAGRNLIYFVDDPYFRAYWLGSSRLFMNSLFFRELLAKERIN
ncbi:MAG: M14 family zinc carboxypeptidase [Rikenellaceae bacterium]